MKFLNTMKLHNRTTQTLIFQVSFIKRIRHNPHPHIHSDQTNTSIPNLYYHFLSISITHIRHVGAASATNIRSIMYHCFLVSVIIAPLICSGSAYSGSMFKTKERPNELYPSYVEQLPSLIGKKIAITGATRGLGYATALACARKGAEVILLSRSSEVAEQALCAIQQEASDAGAPPPIFVECDLLDFTNTRSTATIVANAVAGNGLDVLCCNAGIML